MYAQINFTTHFGREDFLSEAIWYMILHQMLTPTLDYHNSPFFHQLIYFENYMNIYN